jgi:hypothetical protein
MCFAPADDPPDKLLRRPLLDPVLALIADTADALDAPEHVPIGLRAEQLHRGFLDNHFDSLLTFMFLPIII